MGFSSGQKLFKKDRASIEALARAQGLISQDFSPKQFFKVQNTKQADTDGENYR